MSSQVIVEEHNGRRKLSEAEPTVWKYVTDLIGEAIKSPIMIPYAAAFGIGALIGYHNEEDAQGAIRVGLEAVLATHLATRENNFPAQTAGIALMISIGLSLPGADLVRLAQKSLRDTVKEREAALQADKDDPGRREPAGSILPSPEREAELERDIAKNLDDAWKNFLKTIGVGGVNG